MKKKQFLQVKVLEEEEWVTDYSLVGSRPVSYTWRACYKEDGVPWNERIARKDVGHVFTMDQSRTQFKLEKQS